jgi:hypothetical protein
MSKKRIKLNSNGAGTKAGKPWEDVSEITHLCDPGGRVSIVKFDTDKKSMLDSAIETADGMHARVLCIM